MEAERERTNNREWYMATKAVASAEPKGVAVAERGAVVEAVLLAMAEGRTLADAVRGWAKAAGVSVTPGQVRMWIARDAGWLAQYQAMKPVLGVALAEEALRVAREATRNSSAEDRLLIDTLRWAASKLAPLEFGERQVVEHQGAQELVVRVVETDGLERGEKAAGSPLEAETAVVRGVEGAIEAVVVSGALAAALPSPAEISG